MNEPRQGGNSMWIIGSLVCLIVGGLLVSAATGLLSGGSLPESSPPSSPRPLPIGPGRSSSTDLPPTTTPVAPSSDPAVASQPTVGSSTAALNTCSNNTHDWTVDFPADWFEGRTPLSEFECSTFGRELFILELVPKDEIPVWVQLVELDLDSVVRLGMNDSSVDVAETQPGSASAGRSVTLRVVYNGTGFFDAGAVGFYYYISWGSNTVAISTVSPPGDGFEANVRVVEAMAQSLR